MTAPLAFWMLGWNLPAVITVPVRSLTADETLTGNRSSDVRIDLLTRTEAPKGVLDGYDVDHPGSLNWIANASVKGGGQIPVVDTGQDVDWLNDRFRPVLVIDGVGEFPLGVFLASEKPETGGDTARSWTVGLLDKTTIPDQDAVESTYSLDAGTVITDAVVDLIASTGETNMAITPSSATLSGALVWEAGTTKLQIINDLLDAANYFSLYCDGSGQFRAEPYVRPAARPILWEFLDGDKSIYDPNYTRDVDLFSIPNKVIVVGVGDGTAPALTSTATNEDPFSPYSYPSRGRWITRTYTGVEIADQATLDEYAQRRLIEATTPTANVTVAHAYVPGLTINNAVRLRRVPAGIDARHVLSRTEIVLDGTSLVRSTLTEVVDL